MDSTQYKLITNHRRKLEAELKSHGLSTAPSASILYAEIVFVVADAHVDLSERVTQSLDNSTEALGFSKLASATLSYFEIAREVGEEEAPKALNYYLALLDPQAVVVLDGDKIPEVLGNFEQVRIENFAASLEDNKERARVWGLMKKVSKRPVEYRAIPR